MRQLIAIGVAAWIALAATAPAARAQAVVPRPRLEEALARTDQRIATAASLAADAGRTGAEAELASARELQGAARIAIHGPARPRVIMDLTLRARDHADRAIAMLRGLPDPDRVMAQLEQTRDGVDRAGELLGDCPDPQAHTLLTQANDMQALAESAANQDRYLAALQLTSGARERMLQALGVCHLQEEDLPTAAQRALTRTDQVVTRARGSVGSQDGAAQAALVRAQQMQAQALEQQRASQHEAAMRLTFGARANALRAMRLSRPPAPAAASRTAPAPHR